MVKPAAAPGCMGCSCLPWRNHPFFDAAAQGDHALVSSLLTADITLIRVVVGRKHLTAWHIAAKEGHVEVLRALVAAVISCPTAQTELNSSIRRMLSMARTGDRLAKHFLNSRSKNGSTPLMMAAKHGQVEVVDYLMGVGGNPWLADGKGLTALHIAAVHNQCEVIHELCKVTVPYSRLAMSPNTSETSFVDVLDPFGWTPLHHAVLAGRLEAARTLMSHNANVTARTMYHNIKVDLLPTGLTSLHLAAYKGSLPIAKALLRTYFECNSDLVPSQTTMMTTAEQRQRQLSRGPDPRLVLTRTARLPYHFAYRMSHTHMLEWLDPSIPLMFLFAGTEEGATSGEEVLVGAPRLMVIAAKALHELLSHQLEEAEKQLALHTAELSAAREQLAKQKPKQAVEQRTSPRPDSPNSKSNRLLGPFSRLKTSSNNGAAAVTSSHRRTRSSSSLAPTPLGRSSKPTPRSGARKLGPSEQEPGERPTSVDNTRDVLDLGEGGAGLMLRLKQGVRLARTPGPSRACTDQDLLRMGVSIPLNVESDPIAVVVQTGGRSPLSLQTPGSPQRPWAVQDANLPPGAVPLMTLPRVRASEPGRPVAALTDLNTSNPRRISTQEHTGYYLTTALSNSNGGHQLAAPDLLVASPAGDIFSAADASLSPHLLGETPTCQAPQHEKALHLPGQISCLDTATLDAPIAAWATSPAPAEHHSGLRPSVPTTPGDAAKRQGSLRQDLSQAPQDTDQLERAHSGAEAVSPGEGGVVQAMKSQAHRSLANQVHPVGKEDAGSRSEMAWGESVEEGKPPLPAHMRLPTLEESMRGVPEVPSEAGNKLEILEGGENEQEDDDDVCPVCLDEQPNIQLCQCNHQLCMTCAKDLCRRHQLTPALCPYCRVIIPGFTAILAPLPSPL